MDALPRRSDWRGALGQVGAAQSHLAKQGVCAGDLFLFWGLFRPARRSARWEYCGPAEHRIFGWLRIGEIIRAGTGARNALRAMPWLADHPHVRDGWPVSNTIYVAMSELALGNRLSGRLGWGLFQRGMRLTHPSSTLPSRWSVPSWLNPADGGVGMTYHPRERWQSSGELRSATRGQEFVADIGNRADAVSWLENLFTRDA
jgi:hypothetical protein